MNRPDPRDVILQAQCPVAIVPKFGEFAPMIAPGHRFLAAADGLWLEVRRPWLYLRQPIAQQDTVAMPYGDIEPVLWTAWDLTHDIEAHVNRFTREAQAALPHEHAAWLVWNDAARKLEYRPCIAISAGSGHIQYHRPACEPHEHACVDIHSHGLLPPFFSGTDNEDDRGEVKMSIVVGNFAHPGGVQLTSRVCALGLLIYPGICRACRCTDDAPCDGGCEWTEPDLCSACAESA